MDAEWHTYVRNLAAVLGPWAQFGPYCVSLGHIVSIYLFKLGIGGHSTGCIGREVGGGGGGWVGRLLIRLSGATVKMLICVLCELFFEVCTPAVCRTEGW